ncbi:MAG: ABC transporter ATP-binding protein/permease [Clostridia bacterium]|nr:ABC transporter ATP-binding protein/permease [Clostridia bacterium]
MEIFRINSDDLKLLKRAIKYIKPYKIRFSLAFICIFAGIAVGIIQPLLFAKIVTNLFSGDFNGILIYSLYLLLMYLLQMCLGFFQSYLFSYLQVSITFDLKNNMYDKILCLPVKAFDKMGVGDFLSRLEGDASAIASIITEQLLNAVVDIIKVIILSIVIFMVSTQLAFIVILSFPANFLIFSIFGRILRNKVKEAKKISDTYYRNIQESISGIREIKSLGVKNSKLKSYLLINLELKMKNLKIAILNIFSNTITQSVEYITTVLVLVIGGYLTLKGFMKIEYLLAFNSYSNQYLTSLMNLSRLNSNIQQIFTSLERIFGLMDNLNYSCTEFGNVKKDHVKGDIEFKNVIFEHDSNQPVLKEVSFIVPSNKIIAIVGPSGSGKTTIFNLLLRFYEPMSGQILLDNICIGDYDEESLRKHISIVRQEPFLFNVSIIDNLRLVNPSASIEEIDNACKATYIYDHIKSLPQGYNSIIGENGVNFSGGQKQRLAIARALLKNSKVILFDEATSSLDNESQFIIKKTIKELSSNHTIIVIAHRLLTVVDADEIIVIDNGRISGSGTHPKLIKNNAIYKNLYKEELRIINEKSVLEA